MINHIKDLELTEGFRNVTAVVPFGSSVLLAGMGRQKPGGSRLKKALFRWLFSP